MKKYRISQGVFSIDNGLGEYDYNEYFTNKKIAMKEVKKLVEEIKKNYEDYKNSNGLLVKTIVVEMEWCEEDGCWWDTELLVTSETMLNIF